jgi:hypothetical protein
MTAQSEYDRGFADGVEVTGKPGTGMHYKGYQDGATSAHPPMTEDEVLFDIIHTVIEDLFPNP